MHQSLPFISIIYIIAQRNIFSTDFVVFLTFYFCLYRSVAQYTFWQKFSGSGVSPKTPKYSKQGIWNSCAISYPLNEFLLVICKRSVKNCPTAYRLRLVSWPHCILTNWNWDFIYSKEFNNCYILLSNISQSLENAKFFAGEFSLIFSLVLYCPMSVYELW